MEHELGLKSKPDNWTLTTLGEYLDSVGGSIQTGPFGSQLHASDYVEVGTPSVMPKNISVEGINTDDIAKVSNEDMLRLSRYHLESGDIVYSRRGDVEKCALVKEQEAGWLCGTGCLRVRLGNSYNVVSEEFLHSYLSSPMIREWISRNAVGATMPNLNTGILRDVPLLLPSASEAKVIGGSWAALNKKITLNRQINQTLEQMAQTLFKSWFVDFDPVIDNALDAGFFEQDWPIPDELQHRARLRQERRQALRESEAQIGEALTEQQPLPASLPKELRQLFPDAFEESELGWVPKGWGVKTCEEISTRIGMGPFGSNIKVSTFVDSGIPVISGTHLKSVLLNDHSYNFITEEHAQKLKNSAVYRRDIVFTHAGNIGQVALIPDESEYERYMISQRQFYLRPDSSQVKSSYIVHYFHSHLGQHKLLSNASQTGVPSIARPSSHLKGIALVIPSNEVQESFDGLVTRWNEKTMRTRNNIDLLTKLRDTLLPKLISGELRLDDVEAGIADEAATA